MDDSLVRAVNEVERHEAAAGWDRPPALYALVPTADLIRDEPALAEQLGLGAADAAPLTAVAQEALELETNLTDLLARLEWPPEVAGVALAMETVLLPPGVEDTLPDDPAERSTAAATHAGREEARIVVGVLREGTRAAALRWRRHDSDAEVLTGPDIAPALADALAVSLRPPGPGLLAGR